MKSLSELRSELLRPDSIWVHALLVVGASIGFESLFIHHSINLMDEGWPLHAAMGLHHGGTLYEDVFWVFPPGHLLPAWIAYGLDPPGLILSRILYASFTVALTLVIYLLGRRVMPPGYALLGALLLAFAGASAHRLQLIFGYRYLVFSALALLAFARRVNTGDHRFSFVSGLCVGVALYFRLTPAFAASVAIGVGAVAASRSWRSWLRDWAAFAAGLVLVMGPVIAYFANSVGLETLWREAVVRPVLMTDLQSLPMPDLSLQPRTWEHRKIMRWFVAWQFRLYLAMYAAYAVVLAVSWARSFSRGVRFPHTILLTIAIWGGLYFVRTLGRSDAAHLYSAIPPVCLLLAHALSECMRRALRRVGAPARRSKAVEVAVAVGCLGFWIYLMGSWVFLSAERRGQVPLKSLDGRIGLNSTDFSGLVDRTVAGILAHTKPGDTILDLTSSPLLHPLTGRLGVGTMDLVIPGTFADADEERAFVELLERAPPRLVVWPRESFDGVRERHILKTAPQVAAWVRRNYRVVGDRDRFMLMLPKERVEPPSSGARRRPH